MPDAINPSAIPGQELLPDVIEAHAAQITTIAASVRDNGSDVQLKWQGMSGVYSAPESDTLLTLMQPVSSQATVVGDNLQAVASALTQFAAEARPIKAELDSLRAQAQAFVDGPVRNDVRVRELNPAWVSTQTTYGASYSATTAYSSPSTGGATTVDVPKYRTVTKEWHEDQASVDRNNELIAAVNAQQVRLWEAERACANKIRALYGAQALRAATSENDPLGYMLDEIPEGTQMPWGAPVERTEGCGEATLTFVVKDFLWEGIAVGGVWGTVQGLGTLILGYNPATGGFFSGDAYGAAWGNLGMLGAGVAISATPPLSLLFAADDIAQQFGGGFLPEEISDFKDSTEEAWLNTGKALIAWDKWQDDPGTALGESVFNVGTLLIPVGGAAVAGVKTASTAASVLSKAARVVDFVDPAALLTNGALRVGGFGVGSLDNLIGKLELSKTFDTPNLEVYTAMDSASALRALDEWGVDPNDVTARVDSLGNDVLEFPGGRIEMAAGTFDNAAGGARVFEGGADAAIPITVREPELVAAGGVRGETGPGAVNSIVDEAPVRTEIGGDGSSVVRDLDSGAAGHATESGRGGSADNGDFAAGNQFEDGAGTPETGSDNGAARPVSADRVYSMMDGHEHAATFAPEQLGPSRVTQDLLRDNGVTRDQFTGLINRPIDTLSDAERTVVNNVRDSLTAQVTPDTVFQKVMDQPHFEVQSDGSSTLVFGQAENMVLENRTVVNGSVSVADDTAHLATPRDFFESLRLDYPDTNFASHDSSAYVVRFQTSAPPAFGANVIEPQLHSSMGGTGSVDHYQAPFTGNGFLKSSDDILAEYRANKVTMRDGAEVWEVLDDGTQRLFAVLRGDEWIPQGNP